MWRNKVLWTEGLFLRPQHFQQQERYLENLIERRSRAARPWSWGFETLEIDEAALGLGKLSISSAAGALPDGTAFAFPIDDLPPAPLDLDSTHQDFVVHLAIGLERPGVAHVSLGDDHRLPVLRCTARDAEVIDVVEGAGEPAPMQLGSLALALVPAWELNGGFASMPVARVIERRADGQVVLDRQFVAPSLDVRESSVPRGWLGEMRGLLRQRCEALATRMAQPGGGGRW